MGIRLAAAYPALFEQRGLDNMFRSLAIPLTAMVLSFVALAAWRPASAATAYSVSQLNAIANALNAYGQSSDGSKIAGYVSGQAYVHSGGVRTDLGNLAGFSVDVARDVNDAGQAVGFASVTGPGPAYAATDRAFLYSVGVMTQLPTLTGTGYTHAYGINNSGTIVGASANNKPFRMQIRDSALTQLTVPGGVLATGRAHAINNAGDIVGWAANASLQRVPMLWDNGVTPTPLNMPAGADNAEARLIDESGVIAGLGFYSTGATVRPFIYDAAGNAVDMGTLGANYFLDDLVDINSARHAVGHFRLSVSPFTLTPFLYDSATLVNLNSLLPAGSGWVLQSVIGIDDAGVITGTGTFNGTPSGFALTPVPEPGVVGLLGVGVVVAMRRRCR
jgi:hypothetical protein